MGVVPQLEVVAKEFLGMGRVEKSSAGGPLE